MDLGLALLPQTSVEIVRLREDREIASGHASVVKPVLNSEYHPKSLHADPERPQSLRLVVVPLETVIQGLSLPLILWGHKR